MGHTAGKEVYRRLGKKIDNLTMRAPWNETFHALLKELYSAEEAEVVILMPYTASTLTRIAHVSGYEESRLRRIIDNLCAKGLVMDFWANGEYHYLPSPIIIGIFEFTMMRTGARLDVKKPAELLHRYLQEEEVFYAANIKSSDKFSPIRTLPHEESIRESEYTEVLDYEKARSLIEGFNRFSIGFCSCRHAMLHAGEKQCDTPLSTCSSFGSVADFLIRRNFAREVSKSDMLENLSRSRELGLVLNADNVQRNITFICHCCGCCCHALLGISKFGYPNTIVTSGLIADTDEALCNGCGICSKACPIDAIEMARIKKPVSKKKKEPLIDTSICLGCGVCALRCKTKARTMVRRKKRVIHPETTFERVILQSLERGTLQNQIFDDPQRISHKFMRGFIGGFLRLPSVKRSLASDMLRSSFLGTMKKGITGQGKGWMTEL